MALVEKDKVFTVEKKCPYCGADLRGKATAWEKRSNHTWQATEIEMDCVTMPDFESDEYDEWIKVHTNMPYVYWHPVISDILCHIQLYYSFNIEN